MKCKTHNHFQICSFDRFDLLVKNTSLGYYLILVSVSKARDHE